MALTLALLSFKADGLEPWVPSVENREMCVKRGAAEVGVGPSRAIALAPALEFGWLGEGTESAWIDVSSGRDVVQRGFGIVNWGSLMSAGAHFHITITSARICQEWNRRNS